MVGSRGLGARASNDLARWEADLLDREARLRGQVAEQQTSERRWRALQSELAHAARLSTIGHMASTLAHELNQPLTAASAYAEAAVRALDASGGSKLESARCAAASATEQILRAGQIVRSLRDFVAKGESEHRREDLRAVIEEAAAVALIGVHDALILLRLSLNGRPTPVLINRVQIQQVLVNLVRNAVEAMDGVPRRELELRLRTESPATAVVCVADSGRGLAPAIAAQLFSPYNSDKRDGMGVGLSISRTIVEAHGGRIWAEPGGHGGTVFKFSLPVIDDDPADSA